MKYTPNYNLKKPDLNDVADIRDINFNSDKIDTTLKELYDTLGKLIPVVVEGIADKVLTFVFSGGISKGNQPLEMGFPFNGVIKDVSASCRITADAKTELSIEKCSATDYENTPIWTGIFSTNLSIDPNMKSSKNAETPYVFNSNIDVSPNDCFRVTVVDCGAIEDLIVELLIKIS